MLGQLCRLVAVAGHGSGLLCNRLAAHSVIQRSGAVQTLRVANELGRVVLTRPVVAKIGFAGAASFVAANAGPCIQANLSEFLARCAHRQISWKFLCAVRTGKF